jgi:hypothetical protein
MHKVSLYFYPFKAQKTQKAQKAQKAQEAQEAQKGHKAKKAQMVNTVQKAQKAQKAKKTCENKGLLKLRNSLQIGFELIVKGLVLVYVQSLSILGVASVWPIMRRKHITCVCWRET